MNLLLVSLLSIPSSVHSTDSMVQVFVFPSGPSCSSNISSVLYTGNESGEINQIRSNGSLSQLLPQEFTICSSHQQELLDGSPPYQVILHKKLQFFVFVASSFCRLVVVSRFWAATFLPGLRFTSLSTKAPAMSS